MSLTASKPSQWRFSIGQLILLVPWIALVIDAWSSIRDNSFLWHVRAGTIQLDAAEVLTQDPFSFTFSGASWRTQSWLAELLYGLGERASGLGFVPPMLLVTTSLTFVGLGVVAYRKSGSVGVTSLLLFLSTLLMISFFVPRPVIFSFLLFALVTIAWDRPITRWSLPLLFWIWASMHGSFVIGLAYVGLSVIAEKEWDWLPTAIVSGLATLVTAHGVGVLQMLLDFMAAREALSLLSEWQRPSLISPVFTPFLIGLALVVLGFYRRALSPKDLWVILPFAILGFGSLRAVPPAWVALMPFIAKGLRGLRFLETKRFSAVAAAIFAVVVVVLPFVLREDAQVDPDRFPIAATQQLLDVPTFHDDGVGGYLIWADGPDRLVFIDDRAELYQEFMADFVEIREGRAPWEPVFDRYRIRQAILRSDNETLVDELRDSGWRVSYQDEQYLVLVAA